MMRDVRQDLARNQESRWQLSAQLVFAPVSSYPQDQIN